MIAHQGTRLAKLAEKNGVALRFEAAVAGGVPIIKALREGLAANRLVEVYGILNGTCNYILTQMEETERDFDEVLAEAQSLAMRRPIRASISTASTPPISSRSLRASLSASR